MEDKTKLQKGVGQIKEGMGKISEGVGQIVETKFEPKPLPKPMGNIEEAKPAVKPNIPPASFTTTAPESGKPNEPSKSAGQPAAFHGAPPDKVEPKPGAAFTGAVEKAGAGAKLAIPVDPMIEQARRVEAAHPATPVAAPPEPAKAESDLAEHLARQASSQNPKSPGPVGVTPHVEDDKGKPAKPAATLQKPVVPGMSAMRANAPQDWKVGTMPAPEPVVEATAIAKPAPKPVPAAPNVKKSEGVTYIGKYKKFHAEFKASGQTYNVGMYDTEAQAIAEIARAKSHLYP